jgi:hypothetical protein
MSDVIRQDMSDAEWAVTEPTPAAPAWKQGRAGRQPGTAAATSSA